MPGLVGKAHAGRQRRRFAMDEIDRLVHFHADAVAGAVRQAGQLVARAVAPAFVGARAPRHRRCPRARRPSPLRSRSAGRDGPGPTACAARRVGSAPNTKVRDDVRLVAVDRAGAVDQHDVAALDHLRLLAAVRIGRGFADQHQPAVIGRRPAACARRRSSRRCRPASCPRACARRRSGARRA